MVIVLASAFTLFTDSSNADPAEAETAIKQAVTAAGAGDFVGAASHYKLAYAADARPELICNVGVAYYKAKELPRAQLFLSRCLERGSSLDSKFVDSVRKVLASVENTLRTGAFTPVDIIAEPPAATIAVQAFGADESFIGSRVVWLPEGKQALVGRAEGYVERVVDVEVKGHDRQTVRVVLDRSRPTEPIGSGSDAGSGAGSGSAIVTTKPIEAPKTVAPSIVPAVVATGLTAGAILVAVIAHGRAADRADLAQFALTQGAYDDDKSVISRWNTVMGVSTGLAIAGAGLSGYLWYRAFHTPTTVEVNASGSGAGVTFSGRW